jgi:uncharacterized OB-fold protein
MQNDYRRWMIDKMSKNFRFELVSIFEFGETIWEAATKAAEEKIASIKMPLVCDECSAEMHTHHNFCWNCGTRKGEVQG